MWRSASCRVCGAPGHSCDEPSFSHKDMQLSCHAHLPTCDRARHVQHGCKVTSDTFCSGVGEERTAQRPGSD